MALLDYPPQTAPAWKYTTEMRAALPTELLPLLDYELPDDTDADGLRPAAAVPPAKL